MIGKYDGTFDTLVLAPAWYLGYVEITEIIYRIFNKVVDPITWSILEDFSGVKFEEKKTIEKTMSSKEPPDKSRPFKFKMKVEFPWKICDAKEYKPFY